MNVNLAKFLSLERPLASMDLETTGFDPDKDRIVQISLTMHYPHKEPVRWKSLVNPGCVIPNSEIHRVTDAMVVDAPRMEDLAPLLAPKMVNVDIVGYNVDFDIKFLKAQMKRCGINWDWKGYTIDAYQLYRKMIPYTLSNAFKEFGGEDGSPLPPGQELGDAHDASVDTAATEVVLRGQLLRFKDLPRTVKALMDVCFPAKEDWIDSKGKFMFINGVPHITFGKHVKNNGGKPVPMQSVPRDYYKFMTEKDFEPELKEIAGAAMMGVWPVQAGKTKEEPAPF